jgi:V/A-type H+-transporting ATPase subunit I
MAIVKMKHLRLVAMGSDREKLLRKLQHMGCVEIREPSFQSDDPLYSQLTHPEAEGLAAAREEQSGAERALETLKKYAPEKGSFLDPKPGLKENELFDANAAQRARDAAAEVNEAERRLIAIQGEESKRQTQKAVLAPWLTLDMPLETNSTDVVTIQLGSLPAQLPFEQAEQAVRAAADLVELTRLSEDREQQYCLLVCHNSQSEAALQALKDLNWSRANLRDWTGTAAENNARLDRELQELALERVKLEEKLSGMGDLRSELRRLSDLAAVEASRAESVGRMLDTGQTFLMEGWFPEENLSAIKQILQSMSCAFEIRDPTPEEYPVVPVQLKNGPLSKPLNMVTEMYSLPAYGSLDPNPLMAPFFILFYGIMMADMGYGILMILMGAIVLKKKKPGGTFGHMCGLLVLCGITTFIMGVLTGGFFGDFIPQLLKLINPNSTFELPSLFTPLNDTMMVLVGALCLGFIQIIVGMAISFYKKLRDGKVMDAVFEEVTWWIVFVGLALAILGVTNLVLLVGGILVIAGPLVTGQGFVGKVFGIFGSLYNHITGYFGDILSYSRLMALMLAGSVIAQVFNTLGAIPGNIIIFLVISFAGNALNFALNILSCYVHDLRLQCLEFFNKFYEDGGKPFRPLNLNTKYYDVVK